MRNLLAIAAAVLFAPAASAGPYPENVGTCTYDPATSVVHAVNMPTVLDHPVYGTDQAVTNFIREDAAGNVLDAYVLGLGDGEFFVTVPAPVGVETYEFVSQTWGNDGKQYAVYAECTSEDTT